MRKKISDTTFLVRLSNQHKEKLEILAKELGIPQVDVIRNLLDLAPVNTKIKTKAELKKLAEDY